MPAVLMALEMAISNILVTTSRRWVLWPASLVAPSSSYCPR